MAVFVLIGTLIATGVSPAVVSAIEDPRFVTTVPEPTVTPGQSVTLQVQLENTAEDVDERVETASDVRATLGSGTTGISVLSGERIVGTLRNDEIRTLEFRIRVPRDIDAGRHELDLEVEYVDDGERETATVPVTVRVEPRPRFRIVSSDAEVPIGGTGTVTVTLENVGEEAARDATLALQSQASALRFGQSATSSRFVGSLEPGERATLAYRVVAGADAETQRYAVTGTVSFEDPDGNAGRSQTLSIGVTPFEQGFAITDVESSLQVGVEGNVTGRLVNKGPDVAREAVLRIVSQNANLRPVETDVPLGTVGVNDSTGFSVPIRVVEGANPGVRQLEFVIEYEDREGNDKRSEAIDVQADVRSELGFTVPDIESTLRVGEEGDVRVSVTNRGPGTARAAVIRLVSDNPNVIPEETEIALGTFEEGNSTTVTFPIEIADETASGPRQLDFVIEYENRDGTRVRSDTLSATADVAPSRPDFQVSVRENRIEQGETTVVRIRVTNNLDRTLTNVDAKAFFNDPLSSGDDEAFIDELEPGASMTIALEISADASAIPRAYPMQIDFQYELPDGDTRLSDTYKLPIEVVESTGNGGGGSGLVPIAVGAVVVLIVAVSVVWYRRRSR